VRCLPEGFCVLFVGDIPDLCEKGNPQAGQGLDVISYGLANDGHSDLLDGWAETGRL